jgi:hypothetical protein
MFRLFSSLRARLILLVLGGAIPALVLILYADWHHRRQVWEEARKGTLTLARTIANLQDNVIEEGRTLVSTLAQLP